VIVEGKAAIVTGAGTGVGRATALRLAELGCSVLINYSRSRDAAEAAAAEAGTDAPVDGAEVEPLVKEADPELERLIAEEEEIERTLRDQSETPHFRPQDAD